MKKLSIDKDYLQRILADLLAIPSPSGFTDNIVHRIAKELDSFGLEFELTRRGAIRATIPGKTKTPDRAIVSHVDTLGAMVRKLKSNGRLALAPIGTWSSRFAEGGRVTVFTDNAGAIRGTVLPLKASGHIYNKEIDTQPVNWENLELRVDVQASSQDDLQKHGFAIGDFVGFDPGTEFTKDGFVVSRHLDDKAGVASVLSALKAVVDAKIELPVDCHPLFTVSEEVGSGASSVLHQDVAELVSVDNGTSGPGQNSDETGVTISMMDLAGPYDYHLSRNLIKIANDFGLTIGRDVFKWYRSDAASAVEAGNDIHTALLCFGLDASHGYERTHLRSLVDLATILTLYMQSPPLFARDKSGLGPLEGFPELPTDSSNG
ncbi:MAG: osmoprotectant NAGGN system M42 family peptidase [Myxococcales bacterium]|nr:MAG: osmoprotectant NAGGN system M42 family peptidase [Myxococcales bacterium]